MHQMATTIDSFMSRPVGPRRNRQDRRIRGRLRELCDEVLASYRLAQGQDLIAPEEREAAKQVLRSVAPRIEGK
jgi:hypothetical protein